MADEDDGPHDDHVEKNIWILVIVKENKRKRRWT